LSACCSRTRHGYSSAETTVRSLRLTTVGALHDLNLAAMFCDDLAVISAGRIVAAGPPGDVLTAELIADVYDAECLVTTHRVTATPLITFVPRARSRPDGNGWACSPTRPLPTPRP
jgi:iron complex transport system ATP-binding protein